MKNEAKGAEPPGKSRKTMIALIIAIVAVVAIVGYKMIGPRAIVNVEDCYSVEFTGTDEDREITAACDGTKIYQLTEGALTAAGYTPAATATINGVDVDTLVFALTSSFEPHMSEGEDKIELSLTYDEDLAKQLRVKFINTKKTIPVIGLYDSAD